jgi:hypothetical protein
MRYKRKLLILSLVLLLLIVIQGVFPGSRLLQADYGNYIFRPYQALRNLLFGQIPLSIGDILYFIAVLVLIAVHIRWAYFLIRFRSHKQFLWSSLLNTVIAFGLIYLLFFIGWGGNYYKPALVQYWNLNTLMADKDSTLVTYDRFLIKQLNILSLHYEDVPFKKVDQRAQDYYKLYTSTRTRLCGLRVKPSIYGYFMQYLGIQGYYNPFTGEAQVNRFLPSFMLPFVVCHEMAHQSGIGAEDDANLLSYALCITSNDKDFAYSGYFNIWMYTHNRVRQMDSLKAKDLLATLNPVSKSQLDTLRAIRRRYRSTLNEFSSTVYDEYLKLHNQSGGIDSYYGVVLAAWSWEEQRRYKAITKLIIP